MNKFNTADNLDFEVFRQLALNNDISKYERIGFPDNYREGYEEEIFLDIRFKLSNLDSKEKIILDIGPGCSDLPLILIEHCEKKKHELHLIDSAEMLSLLPDKPFIKKTSAYFPNCPEIIETYQGLVDVIICYSVLHYIFADKAFFRFIDISLSLLAPGGQMLIGDIPNISKRKRFFSSNSGRDYHQKFMKTNNPPDIKFNQIEHNHIDDSIILMIIQRARLQGFDAYIIPQNVNLPMANRREDILITRP